MYTRQARRLGRALLLWFGSTWLLTRKSHEQGHAVTILESRCDHPVTRCASGRLCGAEPRRYRKNSPICRRHLPISRWSIGLGQRTEGKRGDAAKVQPWREASSHRQSVTNQLFACSANSTLLFCISCASVEEYIVAALATKPHRQMAATSANSVGMASFASHKRCLSLSIRQPPAPERTGKRCHRRILRASGGAQWPAIKV
jgi:hypothetical protein